MDYPTRLRSARALYRDLTAGPLDKQRERFWQWVDANASVVLKGQLTSLLAGKAREDVTGEELRGLVVSAVGYVLDVFTDDLVAKS